jgi:hypothetical protein
MAKSQGFSQEIAKKKERGKKPDGFLPRSHFVITSYPANTPQIPEDPAPAR